MSKVCLFLIDEQEGFMDKSTLLGNNLELPVPGAYESAVRVGKMISKNRGFIHSIVATLDSHHPFHIANPLFWTDKKGNHPDPFTQITHETVKKGVWAASIPALNDWAMSYTEALESGGRYPLIIWNPHCLIGRPGACIAEPIATALREWENGPGVIRYVTKGSCPYTEHYSVVKAEVPHPSDPTTQINTGLINTLEQADHLLVAGQALDKCVKNSLEDITRDFGDEAMKKITFLTDASDIIPGFEDDAQAFMSEMQARGMNVATTTSFF